MEFVLYMILVVTIMFISIVMLLTLFINKEKILKDPKPHRYPTVSIAIPAYNKEDTIEDVIKSLLNLNYPKKIEIIGVNDGSKDKTLEVMKKYPIKIINKRRNEGKPKALNDALKIARGEIFGFIDADTIIEKDGLKNLIGYFNYRDVAAVIPGIKVYKPKNILEKIQKIEYLLSILSKKNLTFLNCLYATPCCALFRKSILKKIGGFDEKNLTEDLEIGLKIHKAGYRIENSVNSIVYTQVPKNFRDLMRQRIRWYRGLIHNIRKYKELFFEKSDFGLFLMPLVFIGGIITTTIFFLLFSLTIYKNIYEFYIFILGFILSGYDLSLINFDIKLFPLSFLIFSSVFLFILALNIYFSEKIAKEEILKDLFNILIFIIFYTPLLCIWLLYSLFLEMLGVEMKW